MIESLPTTIEANGIGLKDIDLASFEPARDAVEVEGMVAPGFKFGWKQGSLFFPKNEFFIKAIMRGWSFL